MNVRVRKTKRCHHKGEKVSRQSGVKLALKELEHRKRGEKREKKMKGKKKRSQETVRKILMLYHHTYSVRAPAHISKSSRRPNGYPSVFVNLPFFFFFFHLQIMKHKWFRGRLKGIHSRRLWRTAGKHLQKRSVRVGSFLTSTWLGVWLKPPRREAWGRSHTRNPWAVQLFAAQPPQHAGNLLCRRAVLPLEKTRWYRHVTERFSYCVSWRHLQRG